MLYAATVATSSTSSWWLKSSPSCAISGLSTCTWRVICSVRASTRRSLSLNRLEASQSARSSICAWLTPSLSAMGMCWSASYGAPLICATRTITSSRSAPLRLAFWRTAVR
ncbi:hypothetical protein DK45_2752 [Bordetella bronchiseptica]|nr:hypothetical protein DK45_2752 [Bordetella bronchiseptica]